MILLWDCLFGLLVLFPLLTGGIWIHQPGLKLELTELAVPVIVLILIALGLRVFGHRRVERDSPTLGKLQKIWRAWERELALHPYRTLWISALGVGALWSYASLRRHWAYGSGASDLGIFTSAIWNLTHGHGYISSVKDGINLFSDHQSPLFWALAPLFAIFPQAETLLIAQAFGLSAGGVAIYFLGRQYLDRDHWGSAALPLLYWAYLPIRNANAFDFHPEVFILPLFLASIVGLQSTRIRHRWLGILALIGALAGKESAGPVAAGIGMAWLLGAAPLNCRTRMRFWGIAPIVIGLIAFALCTQWVPGLFGGTYVYSDQYSRFGQGLGHLLLAPLQQPREFFAAIFGKTRLKFLLWTLLPLGFLPLCNPRAALASLPGYLMLFLSSGDHRVNLQYHYGIEPAVGLLWALPGAFTQLPKFKRINWPLWLLICAALGFGRSEVFRIRKYSPTSHQEWLSSTLIPALSSGSLSVSGAMVPHAANRTWVHHLPKYRTSDGNPVDCIIRDDAINNWPLDAESERAFGSTLTQLDFREVYRCSSTRVFQNAKATESCLKTVPSCPNN